MIAVPHSVCLYPIESDSSGNTYKIYFKSNSFINEDMWDCDNQKYFGVETDKDVVVYVNGEETRTITQEEACKEQG